MYSKISNYFTNHPSSVNMSYIEHGIFSLSLAWYMAIGSIKAVIHAINPNWFIDSTSSLSLYLHKNLHNK